MIPWSVCQPLILLAFWLSSHARRGSVSSCNYSLTCIERVIMSKKCTCLDDQKCTLVNSIYPLYLLNDALGPLFSSLVLLYHPSTFHLWDFQL